MTQATIHRDEVQMYDGNLVSIELEVEADIHHDPGCRWTPPHTECEVTSVNITSIDACDADDNEIVINLDDPNDPYVQSVNQHLEDGTIEFDEELCESHDPYDDGYV